jgi:YbbR domain-containing protein
MAINGSEPNADRYLRLPVSPFGLPAELVIANQDAWHVEVQVRGPRSILRTIDEEAHRVALDLRGVDAGPTSMKVAAEMLNLPRRVRVVGIEPPRIELRVEKLLQKSVAVRAVLVPSRRNGYTVSRATVTPSKVDVSGPSSRVARLQVIETEPVSTFVEGEVEREVSLAGAGEWLTYSPDAVQVAFAVTEVESRRTFANVAVALRSAGAGSLLEPAALRVTVRGPQLALTDLKAEDVAPHVDAGGLGPGRHAVKPEIALPSGFHVAAVFPEVLQLTVPEELPKGGAEGAAGQNVP